MTSQNFLTSPLSLVESQNRSFTHLILTVRGCICKMSVMDLTFNIRALSSRPCCKRPNPRVWSKRQQQMKQNKRRQRSGAEAKALKEIRYKFVRSIRCQSRHRPALKIPSSNKSARKLLKTLKKRGKSSTLILNRLSVVKRPTSLWTNSWKVGTTIEWMKLIASTEKLRKKRRKSERWVTDLMMNKLSKIMMKILSLKLWKMRPPNKNNNLNKMLKRKLNLKRNERSVQMLMKKLKILKPLSQVLIMALKRWRHTMVEIEMIMSPLLIINLKTKKKKSQNSSTKDLSRRSKNHLRWTSLISTSMLMKKLKVRHKQLRKAKRSDERIRRTFNLR